MEGIKILPGDMLYFQYKNLQGKIDQYILLLLDYNPSRLTFQGIDMFKLFSIDSEYPVYFYNTFQNAVKQKKHIIDEVDFKNFFEKVIAQHPVSRTNEKRREMIPHRATADFLPAVMLCYKMFKLSTKQIQSNFVVNKFDFDEAMKMMKKG